MYLPGCHGGIVFIILSASSSSCESARCTSSKSVSVPSFSTVKVYTTSPCLLLSAASRGYLSELAMKLCIAAVPPVNSGGISGSSYTLPVGGGAMELLAFMLNNKSVDSSSVVMIVLKFIFYANVF